MADIEPQQVNELPGNSFQGPRSVPPWRQNHVLPLLRDARVSLNIVTLFVEDARLSVRGTL